MLASLVALVLAALSLAAFICLAVFLTTSLTFFLITSFPAANLAMPPSAIIIGSCGIMLAIPPPWYLVISGVFIALVVIGPPFIPVGASPTPCDAPKD